MIITTKEKVQDAVNAALRTTARGNWMLAEQQAAQALCLPVEAVRDAMQPAEESEATRA